MSAEFPGVKVFYDLVDGEWVYRGVFRPYEMAMTAALPVRSGPVKLTRDELTGARPVLTAPQ